MDSLGDAILDGLSKVGVLQIRKRWYHSTTIRGLHRRLGDFPTRFVKLNNNDISYQ